jgi:hypothetical protein
MVVRAVGVPVNHAPCVQLIQAFNGGSFIYVRVCCATVFSLFTLQTHRSGLVQSAVKWLTEEVFLPCVTANHAAKPHVRGVIKTQGVTMRE